jgi:ribose 5-phosphate isomerase A
MIVIVDAGKLVEVLGAFPLPIEVVSFGLAPTTRAIETTAAGLGLSGPIILRTVGNVPFRTDSGHLILDAAFGRIDDPAALAEALAGIPGVVEHGLFLHLASAVIVAHANGIEWLSRDGNTSDGASS